MSRHIKRIVITSRVRIRKFCPQTSAYSKALPPKHSTKGVPPKVDLYKDFSFLTLFRSLSLSLSHSLSLSLSLSFFSVLPLSLFPVARAWSFSRVFSQSIAPSVNACCISLTHPSLIPGDSAAISSIAMNGNFSPRFNQCKSILSLFLAYTHE